MASQQHVAFAEQSGGSAFSWGGGRKGQCWRRRRRGAPLGSESFSSPAASAPRRAVAVLTRGSAGLGPRSVAQTQSPSVRPRRPSGSHQRSWLLLPPWINHPIHWGKPEFSGSRLGVTCAGCLRVCRAGGTHCARPCRVPQMSERDMAIPAAPAEGASIGAALCSRTGLVRAHVCASCVPLHPRAPPDPAQHPLNSPLAPAAHQEAGGSSSALACSLCCHCLQFGLWSACYLNGLQRLA